MALYMIQASYTPEAWAAQIRNPGNRFEQLREVFEAAGGTLHHMWYAFGDSDVVLIAEGEGNIDAAAVAIVATAGGAVKSLRTTPLLSVDDGIAALRKAGEISYRPPAAG